MTDLATTQAAESLTTLRTCDRCGNTPTIQALSNIGNYQLLLCTSHARLYSGTLALHWTTRTIAEE